MAEFETRVVDVIHRTSGVLSVRLKPADGVDFRPGQYFFITVSSESGEIMKPLSISNSPTEKGYFEFTKRLTGSEFSKAIGELVPGSKLKVRMPYGKFTFEGEYPKIALLSGGIGITPFRSIIKYAADMKLPSDITLLYGADTEKDIIFKGDLDAMMAENKRFKAVYTLTAPDVRKCGWKGCCGYIDGGMMRKEVPDFAERVFFVCGPPGMVTCLLDVLKKELNVPEDRIVLERFAGY